jgi:hypothetical protein
MNPAQGGNNDYVYEIREIKEKLMLPRRAK